MAELAGPLLIGLLGTAFGVGMVLVVNSVMLVVNSVMLVGGGLPNRRGEVP